MEEHKITNFRLPHLTNDIKILPKITVNNNFRKYKYINKCK